MRQPNGLDLLHDRGGTSIPSLKRIERGYPFVPASEIRKMSPSLSLQAKALGLLARREHSRVELAQKLGPYTKDPAELAAVLDDLEHSGFLSDARYAAEFVRAKSRRFGAVHLAYRLREKGVAEAEIQAALSGLESDELARAQQVWRAKFAAPPTSLAERGKQTRFLAGRGFSSEIIRKILRGEAD